VAGVDDARSFLERHHRAILITRRDGGGLQTSPVSIGVDDDGAAIVSTREDAAKTRNLRRDPSATATVTSDDFRQWIQVDGTATIVGGEEAIEPLVDYYRRLAGEHPDWDEYRQAMRDQHRVLLRISIERVSPRL
jgi:PPOX class probable F420-dependent enzyme